MQQPPPDLRALSPAQRRVLALIAAGRITKEIADELHISEKGVEYHRHRIYARLGLRRVADAVRVWMKEELRKAGKDHISPFLSS